MSSNPMYLSAGLQEYHIVHDGSLWRVQRWRGGQIARDISGGWMSHKECENALCAYLRCKDKFGKAIYPGCPALEKNKNDGERVPKE